MNAICIFVDRHQQKSFSTLFLITLMLNVVAKMLSEAVKKSPPLPVMPLSVGYDVCSLHSLDKHPVYPTQMFGQEGKLAAHLLLTLINAFKFRDADV